MMKTVVMPINDNSLRLGRDILFCGGVVAFPTETVYGLGGLADNDEAIKSIYTIKGRPSDNPLIVHLHKNYDITNLIIDEMPYAKILREKFLPGPLTMVYKSRGTLSPLISCGLNTVAIRVPSHEGCQKFLEYVGKPIAAPSANISKHISPVTSGHVLKDLSGKIPLILEGGQSDAGIESTVLDVSGKVPVILRTGVITSEMIIDAVGFCESAKHIFDEKIMSPGVKYSHYMPDCKTAYFLRNEIKQATEFYENILKSGKKPYIMCDEKLSDIFAGKKILNLGLSPKEITSNLYIRLREGEEKADIIIGIELESDSGLYAGVSNRMKKAFSIK
jgi:L-threonylcarbamoyladenylate synthase